MARHEFAIVARVDAENLLSAVRHVTDGFEPKVRISLGSTFADHDDDVSSLLRRADQRMYVTKASGAGPHRRHLSG